PTPDRRTRQLDRKMLERKVLFALKNVQPLYRFTDKGADMRFLKSLRFVAITTVFAGSSVAQTAPVKLPAPIPGKLMGEWFSMCTAPKLDQLRKWDAEHYFEEIFKFMPADKIADSDLKECNESG